MIVTVEISTARYKKFAEVVGRKNVHFEIDSPIDFINIANEGVNVSAISNFSRHFNLSKEFVAQILDISSPTLYRWTKANKSLERNFSVKLFDIIDLFLYGEEVFGDRDKFFKWLKLPNEALGGNEPLTLMEIPGCLSLVRDILGRIEYGVYS
jgi:putative toxin-antitoxin system antitoxin component (TIGR02293 family)